MPREKRHYTFLAVEIADLIVQAVKVKYGVEVNPASVEFEITRNGQFAELSSATASVAIREKKDVSENQQ